MKRQLPPALFHGIPVLLILLWAVLFAHAGAHNPVPATDVSSYSTSAAVTTAVGAKQTTNAALDKLAVNDGSSLTNLPVQITVTVTNVMADFPSLLVTLNADLSYPLTQATTNMVIVIGPPPTQNVNLNVVGLVASNGYVTLRAQNVGTATADQANLMYRVQITTAPLQ